MDPVSIISAFVVGGGIQAVVSRLTAYSMAKKTLTADQATRLIDTLAKRVDTMETKHEECLGHHEDCMKENKALSMRIGELSGRLDEVSQLSTKTAIAVKAKD
jgi:hypothetical protein